MIKHNHKDTNFVLTIFGAAGDLAKRKLYPSIYSLYKQGLLSRQFAVLGISRRQWSQETLRENVLAAIRQSNIEIEDNVDDFLDHLDYLPLDVMDKDSFQTLNNTITQLEEKFKISGNRMFYLAMAPQFFGVISSNLKTEGVTSTKGWNRLIIEKPFGEDFVSAQKLNNELRRTFREDEIYRIDHYLGKTMVQNIEVIRFGNVIFEPLWNSRYIDNIQITSSESLGVEERGGYYDKAGSLKDMVQNHMMQIVALLAMEPPIRQSTDEIRSEKIKVLRALRPVKENEVDDYFVRGQYAGGFVQDTQVQGYRDEPNVQPDSKTETFVAGKLMIDNFRWAGTPIYIRTGKRMKDKTTKIVIQFKDLPMDLYYKGEESKQPNLLIIHIQPDEGISLVLNGKEVNGTGTTPIKLDYCNNCIDSEHMPEAYERLLYDATQGDATNFTHWDEVALSWNFVDVISKVWKSQTPTEFPNYESGSMGPKKADELLAKDGFKWWPILDSGFDFE